jgi:hypothetical protein
LIFNNPGDVRNRPEHSFPRGQHNLSRRVRKFALEMPRSVLALKS